MTTWGGEAFANYEMPPSSAQGASLEDMSPLQASSSSFFHSGWWTWDGEIFSAGRCLNKPKARPGHFEQNSPG